MRMIGKCQVVRVRRNGDAVAVPRNFHVVPMRWNINGEAGNVNGENNAVRMAEQMRVRRNRVAVTASRKRVRCRCT